MANYRREDYLVTKYTMSL